MYKWSLFAAVLLTFAVTSDASAQGRPGRRYQPARPTFSPYLDLFRRDAGPTTQYHRFLRQGRRQRQAASSMRRDLGGLQGRIDSQGGQLNSLQRGFQTFQSGGVLSRTGRSPATFMNYSHYYRR